MTLLDGSGLRLTTSLYYTPKDRMIQGIGIEPDIRVVDPSNRNKSVVREEDLPRHLRNMENKNKKNIKEKIDRTPDITSKNKNGVKDYLLERAVIFIKKKNQK